MATSILFNKMRYFAVAWLFFLITIIPVIGMLQAGIQSMANRYRYLSCLGIFVLAGRSQPGMESFNFRNQTCWHASRHGSLRNPALIGNPPAHRRLEKCRNIAELYDRLRP